MPPVPRNGSNPAMRPAPITDPGPNTEPVPVVGPRVPAGPRRPGPAGPARHGQAARRDVPATGPRPEDVPEPRAPEQDDAPAKPPRKKRRRTTVLLLAVLLLGGVATAGVYSFVTWFAVPDFEGNGTGDVVIEVEDGDSTRQIGAVLAQNGVVAAPESFTRAAEDEDRIRGVQPGFYQLRRQMSGAAAVEMLLDPAARVGQLDIRGGVQLDDTRAPDGSVAPGVLTLISEATCARLDGEERCVSVDELRSAMTDTDPATLGVPEWALEGVSAAEPRRRLEGLLVPGRYDVPPGETAVDVLHGLLATSGARLEAAGLVAGAQSIGSSPYEVLTIASLVEKEAINPDMPKVARVIYNRLGAGRRLELDSMVNYPLDLQALRTTAEDRSRPGPYNSYAVAGLPPTPIAAPGKEAIAAALEPEPGPWLYFVRCQTDGTSCFGATIEEHNDNVRAARQNGAF
ncbi:endolytic transglycosylase MltG [Pseudonocardia sp. DLS-67]